MQKNIVGNENIDFIAKKVFIPASAFVQSQVTGASVVLNAAFGAGANELLEVGTSSLGAIRFTDTTGDINTLWVPSDFDNRHPLYVRYLWGTSYAGGGGTVTFQTLYRTISQANPLATAATALTKTHGISPRAVAIADTIQWSNYGYIAPLATGADAYHTFPVGTNAVVFNMKITAAASITLATDFVHVLGMELSYTPRLTFGASDRKARLLVNGLHPTLELDAANDL